MKRRSGFVEYRPEVAKCLLVPSIAERRRARERGARAPAAGRPSSPSACAQARRASPRGPARFPAAPATSPATSSPVSPYCGWSVSRANRSASDAGRRGGRPVTCVRGRPGVVHERLGEQPEPSLLPETVDRAAEEPRAEREVARLLRRDPDDGSAASGSATSCSRIRETRRRTDRPGQLRIRERDDREQARVVVGERPCSCAVSTRYCRVRGRVRVHQQRCAIGTSERSAMSASPAVAASTRDRDERLRGARAQTRHPR